MTDLRIVSQGDGRVTETRQRKLRKLERREQILLELKLRPHVRIGDLAARFGVSGETIRRDVEALSGDGLLNRAHGGASALAHGRYPGFDERSTEQVAERERIGRFAASIVQPEETIMVDSGSTTLQFARFLAFRGTPCTIITNSLPIAMVLGRSAAQVILCPGDYMAEESAVVGTETIDFLQRHRVDRCVIGAAALSTDGPSEVVRGFAAIKRAMLTQSTVSHLLISAQKFGRREFVQVDGLGKLTSVITDARPDAALEKALVLAQTDFEVAP